MVLIKTTILDENNIIKVLADKLNDYKEALDFSNYLINKTKFNIIKIEIEKIEE